MTEHDQADQQVLELRLNHYARDVRRQALQELAAMARAGQIETPAPREIANMHCHTFFSYNAYGYSPSGLAWLAKKQGIGLMGKVDFDVLDGVEEFLEACDLVGVRGSAAIESRVFFPEFSTREINSPGEPGVYYAMGIGLTRDDAPGAAAGILWDMQNRAAARNRDMIRRLNSFLDPVTIDYETDVLPLTPAGNATERHILAAYLSQVEKSQPDPLRFWSQKLAIPLEHLVKMAQDGPAFQNQVRARLMKKGGPGYSQPGEGSFPAIRTFHQAITACDGLICAAWLDGLSAGEQAIDELLGSLVDQGAVALNIIPDRNWNVADPALKKVKLDNLYQVVGVASRLDLPIHVGTEMNSSGQKWVDDFTAPELAPLRPAFIDGAYFIYGHTVLQRRLGLGYASPWAEKYLSTRRERNAFYTRMGRMMTPGVEGWKALEQGVARLGGVAAMTPSGLANLLG